MIRSLISGLRRRAADDDGAIALMTLAFLVFAGMVMVVFLWTIGYAGGAYNTLQGAAQATAYSAAGTVSVNPDDAQPAYQCSGPEGDADNDGLCRGGRTFAAAENTLAYALDASPADFGMKYTPGTGSGPVYFDDSAPLTDTHVNGIYAYSLSVAPGEARALDPTCTGHATVVSNVTGRTCWMLMNNGVGEPQYVSGVAVYLSTTIRLPGCVASYCPAFPITAVAGASQGQDETQPYE